MRLSIVFLLLCATGIGLSAQKKSEPPSPGSFELQGDMLDENLDTFMSNHPKAKCIDATNQRKNCYQWVDISIFGMTAHADPGCSPETHSLPECTQGLSAQFVGKRLSLLTYAVSGSDKRDATLALKKKYGNPTINTSEATVWQDGNAVFSVVVGKASEQKDAPTLVAFVIQG